MSLSTTFTETELEKYIAKFSKFDCTTDKEKRLKRFYGCLQLMIWIYLDLEAQKAEDYICQIFIYMYESAKVQVKLEPAPNSKKIFKLESASNSKKVFQYIINKNSSSSAFRLIDNMSGLKLGLSTDSVEKAYKEEYEKAKKKNEKEYEKAEELIKMYMKYTKGFNKFEEKRTEANKRHENNKIFGPKSVEYMEKDTISTFINNYNIAHRHVLLYCKDEYESYFNQYYFKNIIYMPNNILKISLKFKTRFKTYVIESIIKPTIDKYRNYIKEDIKKEVDKIENFVYLTGFKCDDKKQVKEFLTCVISFFIDKKTSKQIIDYIKKYDPNDPVKTFDNLETFMLIFKASTPKLYKNYMKKKNKTVMFIKLFNKYKNDKTYNIDKFTYYIGAKQGKYEKKYKDTNYKFSKFAKALLNEKLDSEDSDSDSDSESESEENMLSYKEIFF